MYSFQTIGDKKTKSNGILFKSRIAMGWYFISMVVENFINKWNSKVQIEMTSIFFINVNVRLFVFEVWIKCNKSKVDFVWKYSIMICLVSETETWSVLSIPIIGDITEFLLYMVTTFAYFFLDYNEFVLYLYQPVTSNIIL